MNKRILYFLIVLFPFFIMIITNEIVRFNKAEKGYTRRGIVAINSVEKTVDKCSWNCHNDTQYCKKNHVKYVKLHFDKIDPIYFGIISLLKSTGNYGLANIVFLVLLFPLIMFLLLTKIIDYQIKINKINKDGGNFD